MDSTINIQELSDMLSNIDFGIINQIDDLAEQIEPISLRELYKCDLCEFETHDQICLLDHTLINHDGLFSDNYFCDECDNSFATIRQLDDHIKIHKATKVDVDDKTEDSDDTDDKADDKTDDKTDDDTQDDAKNDETEAKEGEIVENESKENDKIKINKIKIIKQKSTYDLHKYCPTCGYNKSVKSINKKIISIKKYDCPICNRQFRTMKLLNDHFTNTHQSYDSLKDLDKKINNTFLGFELLDLLKVVKLQSIIDIKKLVSETCLLCCESFHMSNYIDNKIINFKMLDNLTNINKKYKFFDDCAKINKDNIYYPLTITCCNTNVCHKCIIAHFTKINDIICPFCDKNHNKIKLDYIKIYSIGKTNKIAWENWWKKGDRINLLM